MEYIIKVTESGVKVFTKAVLITTDGVDWAGINGEDDLKTTLKWLEEAEKTVKMYIKEAERTKILARGANSENNTES